MKMVAIMPAYNEEGKIGMTVRRTVPYVDKVVVIDDCSGDNTSVEARKNGAVVICHKSNLGAGAAIRTGMRYATENGYGICVVLGGDNQDNPAEIPSLTKEIESGRCDFVQGSRYLKNRSILSLFRKGRMPLFKSIATRIYTLFFRLVSGYPVTDASNGFRAFKTVLYKEIDLDKTWLNRYELEPYFMLKVIKCGYKFKEVSVTKKYDVVRGYTKMKPLVDWFRITKPLIKELLGL